MKNSENILNEIKEMAPTLSGIKKSNSFHASDQYFDELSVKIQQKITTEKKENKTIKLLSYFQKPQFAIAASLFVILCISAVYFYQNKHNQVLAQNNTIYWDEILNENNTVADKIDEALLVETLIDEGITESDISQLTKVALDEVLEYIESEYSNDVFYEL